MIVQIDPLLKQMQLKLLLMLLMIVHLAVM